MASSITIVLVLFVTSAFSKVDKVGVNVKVNLDMAHFTASDRFLCVTIDSFAMRNDWGGIDLTTPLLVTLAKGLAPVTLRVGGTSQDYAYFVPNSGTVNHKFTSSRMEGAMENKLKKNGFKCVDNVMDSNFNVSTRDWDVLNEFVQKAGWDFVFGLNSNIKNSDGTWDSSNAEELVKYTMSKDYPLLAWELGNEPKDSSDLSDPKLIPQPLSGDFITLYNMLQRVGWPNVCLAGPDTSSITGSDNYYTSFLQDTKQDVLHAATYHQYYMGSSAQAGDFISVGKLDGFINEAWLAVMVSKQLQPQAKLWLGETSTGYDGGDKGLSDVYIAGFMWLDKLGVAAMQNHSKVFRQTFYGGFYSLTYADYTPTPDYWLSVLYVRLVGPTVLSVSNGLKKRRSVRVYAHCVRPSDRYQQGGVVLYMLNLLQSETNISLSDENLYTSSRDVYWLEPGDDNGLRSRNVALNGQVVTMVNDFTLPDLPPKQDTPTEMLSLPPLSFGFIVFKDAKAPACMTT